MLTKVEIARFEQFLLLSTCFQKAVCCSGIRKRLYEGNVTKLIFVMYLFEKVQVSNLGIVSQN